MSAPASFGGAKSIGFYTSLILLINNITGPGIPSLPNMFAEAGWLLPILCLLGVYFMTTLSSCMFCEAMERMPGNRGFRGRSEYSTVVFHYFGRRWYLAAQVGLNGALQALNIISVVQSAQVMDVAISALFGKTCALNLTPFPITDPSNHSAPTVAGSNSFFSCFNTADLSGGNAWGCHVVLTLGFALTATMAIPCGRWNLDDNMIIQRGAFVLTVFCWVVWLVACLSSLSSSSTPLPAINTNPVTGSVAGVLGTILFNFGFVTTVPSWVNEKHPSTNINSALWSATSLCVLIFCLMGIPAALTFAPFLQGPVTGTCVQQQADPSFNCANDLMQLLIQPQTAPWQSSRAATVLLETSVYMFPIVAVVSSIPVFSIVIKYNLVENGASPRVAFAWGVLFPWLCAFPLVYMPDLLGQFVSRVGLEPHSSLNACPPLSDLLSPPRSPLPALPSPHETSVRAPARIDQLLLPPLRRLHRLHRPLRALLSTAAAQVRHLAALHHTRRRRGNLATAAARGCHSKPQPKPRVARRPRDIAAPRPPVWRVHAPGGLASQELACCDPRLDTHGPRNHGHLPDHRPRHLHVRRADVRPCRQLSSAQQAPASSGVTLPTSA